MGIKLERLMKALGLSVEWTKEDRAEIKERREKLNQPLDHITDDIRAGKILNKIHELVIKLENLENRLERLESIQYSVLPLPKTVVEGYKFTYVDNKTEQPNISDIVRTIYLRDIKNYVYHKYIGELDTELTQKRIACEIESVKQYLISEGYKIRL